ncbi:Uncharacterized protein DAT39_005054 [Clarias magur]|uniref:Uncharacterized protein n=1 Tax=Clarias magur TaxID=1594786 RepID=A0A8J4UVQ4_CLAMG|nr:Uncharacterized protein DAT39_005054 [Clarias magur]
MAAPEYTSVSLQRGRPNSAVRAVMATATLIRASLSTDNLPGHVSGKGGSGRDEGRGAHVLGGTRCPRSDISDRRLCRLLWCNGEALSGRQCSRSMGSCHGH